MTARLPQQSRAAYEFGNFINRYSQIRSSFNTETLGGRRTLTHVTKVGCILYSQSNRKPPWNHRSTALESCPHGRGERRPLEFKVARHEPKIVIILHSAVCHSELHHGLELLGHNSLSRIGADARE